MTTAPFRPLPVVPTTLALLLTLLLATAPVAAQGGRVSGPFSVQDAPAELHATSVEVFVQQDEKDATVVVAVPAGKRFLVELVTALVRLPVGQDVSLLLGSSGPLRAFFIPLQPQGVFGSVRVLHAYLPGRFYLDSSQTSVVQALRNDTVGLASAFITLSGYLLELPAPAPPSPAAPRAR